MKNFLTLTKLLFKLQFRVNATEGNDKKKRGGTIAAFIVLGICFLPMLGGLAFMIFGLGGMLGANQGVVALLILACQMLVLLLGVSSLVVGVFMPRDADKLMYLPVKSSTIFAAKLTVAYLNEVITTAVTILFMLLPYGIGAGMGVGYYLMLVLALFLIPLLPILLGTIVAMPIALLLSKVGKNGIGKTLLSVAFFVIVMGVYFVLMFGMMDMGATADPNGEMTLEQMLEMVKGTILQVSDKMVFVHTNYVLAGSMIATTFADLAINLVLAIVEFVALLGLALLMAVPFYRHMLANQVEGGGGSRKAKLQYETKPTSVLKQLISVDLKRTLRDSQMGFQSFVGLIMMPMIVIVMGASFAMGAQSGGEEDVIDFTNTFYQMIAPIALVAYLSLLGAGANVLGLYPITRENKSFYILKSLPVEFNKILMSKVILSTVVMVLVYLLTAIAAVVVMQLEWYYGLAMMFVLTLTGFGAQCLTTRIDLKSPKLGWSNFNQSLKNAKNSWLAMLIGLIVMVIVGIVAAVFIVLYVATENFLFVPLMWVALIVVSALFAFVGYKIMVKDSQQLFERIEA